MPYNPQISYHGDQAIAQGRQNLMQAVMLLVGGLSEQSRQTKELRTTLSTVDPAKKDAYNKMGLGELQGAAKALELRQKQETAKLAQQQAQLVIAHLQSQKQAGEAFSQAAGQAMAERPVSMQNFSMVPGTGSILGQVSAGVQQGAPSQESFLRNILQTPRAVNAPGAATLLSEFYRTQTPTQRGMPEVTNLPGLGGGQIPTIYNRFTGQFEVDPAYTAKVKQEFHTLPISKSNVPPTGRLRQATDTQGKPVPNLYDVLDEQGKITGRWANPHAGAAKSGVQLDFSGGGGAAGAAVYESADDVVKAFKAGKIKYDEASRILTERFGVTNQ